jgi:glycerophosphoryl diester phosphodiesterase
VRGNAASFLFYGMNAIDEGQKMLELDWTHTGRVLVYGHRGAGFLAPENTLESFKLAQDIGVDTIELDVHLTRDGALAVMHDPDVSRTTDGTGRIGQMTLVEVRRLDAGVRFGRAYAGAHVPTLLEALDWAHNRIPLLIEIKGDPEPYAGVEAAVVSAVQKAAMADQVLVKSFYHQSVRKVRDLAPEIATGILLASAPVDPVGLARGAGADSLRNLWSYWTEDAVRAARAVGLHTSAWGVNDEAALARVLALGLDSFGTDRPRWAREELERMK